MNERFPEEPRLEIVPSEKAPEISRVPPDVAGKIIEHIDEEEREEREREERIKQIIDRNKK